MKHLLLFVVALTGLCAAAAAQVRSASRSEPRVVVRDHGDRAAPRWRAREVGRHGRGVIHGAVRPAARHVVRHVAHPARYRTVYERVWVPGYYREHRVPARYGWLLDACGRRHWGIVEPACVQRVWVPGRYERRARRVGCR